MAFQLIPPQMMLLACQTADITADDGPACEYGNKKGRDKLSRFTTEVDGFSDRHDFICRAVGAGSVKRKQQASRQESSQNSAVTLEYTRLASGPHPSSNSHDPKSCSNESGGSGSGSGSGKSQQKSNSESSTSSSGSSHHRSGSSGRLHRGGRQFGSGSDSDDDDGDKKRRPPRKLNRGPKSKVFFEEDDEATDSADEGADDSVMEVAADEGGGSNVTVRQTSGNSSIIIESNDENSGDPVNMAVGYGAALSIDAAISPRVMDKYSPDSESCGAGTPTQDSPRGSSPADTLLSPEVAPILQVRDCVFV